ncbi:uncharacterized protein LOC142335454 [Convolutriloba macropyga]|uniref:uncharacterized protein LOC142335454 n=1 Tax=Convolutriloba macropyga TaxID=536237 RepID=UPI003F5263C2
MIGTCGMGSLSRGQTSYPDTLQEAHFSETKLETPFIPYVHEPVFCREDNICTERITRDANTCTMDDGSPVYQFECRHNHNGSSTFRVPKCLYGVVSFHEGTRRNKLNTATNSTSNRDREVEECSARSIFASVPNLLPWIRQVIRSY